jgi:hypothetical protein
VNFTSSSVSVWSCDHASQCDLLGLALAFKRPRLSAVCC